MKTVRIYGFGIGATHRSRVVRVNDSAETILEQMKHWKAGRGDAYDDAVSPALGLRLHGDAAFTVKVSGQVCIGRVHIRVRSNMCAKPITRGMIEEKAPEVLGMISKKGLTV